MEIGVAAVISIAKAFLRKSSSDSENQSTKSACEKAGETRTGIFMKIDLLVEWIKRDQVLIEAGRSRFVYTPAMELMFNELAKTVVTMKKETISGTGVRDGLNLLFEKLCTRYFSERKQLRGQYLISKLNAATVELEEKALDMGVPNSSVLSKGKIASMKMPEDDDVRENNGTKDPSLMSITLLLGACDDVYQLIELNPHLSASDRDFIWNEEVQEWKKSLESRAKVYVDSTVQAPLVGILYDLNTFHSFIEEFVSIVVASRKMSFDISTAHTTDTNNIVAQAKKDPKKMQTQPTTQVPTPLPVADANATTPAPPLRAECCILS